MVFMISDSNKFGGKIKGVKLLKGKKSPYTEN